MKSNIKFFKDFVKLDIVVDSQKVLFQVLANPLIQYGLVKDEYVEKIIEREMKFPTGISLGKFGIAIPHTEPKYVDGNAMVVGVLKKPIIFQEMTLPEQQVNVNIVFLLALKDSKNHLFLLKNVTALLQNENALKLLLENNDRDEVFNFITNNVLER